MSRYRNIATTTGLINGNLFHEFINGTASDPYKVTGTLDYASSAYETNVYRAMTDVVVPDYRKKIARGEIINNPMSSHKRVIKDEMAPWSRAFLLLNANGGYSGQRHSGIRRSSDHTGPLLPAPDVTLNCEDIAVTKAYANIELSEATALMMAAEADKTIASIAQIVKRVIRIARAVENCRVKELAGELRPREIADRYMEARYAIRPLLYDARAITNALANDDLFKDRRTWRGYCVDEAASHDDGYVTYHGGQSHIEVNRLSTTRVEARAGVLCKLEALNNLNVWGLDQPLETMWELVPLSFVLGWFFNVAETLASWTPEGGVRHLASWVVLRKLTSQCNHISALQNIGANYDIDYWTWPGSYTEEHLYVTRVVDPSRSILPSFNLRLDAFKLLDLALIGKQILKRL